jgi:hypothetical protein
LDRADTRTSERVPPGEIRVETVPPGSPLSLLDVGAGGFLVSGPHPFPIDESFDFWFHAPKDGGWSTALTARAVYGHERTLPGRRPAEFVCGFAFEHTDLPLVRGRIDDLIEQARAALLGT